MKSNQKFFQPLIIVAHLALIIILGACQVNTPEPDPQPQPATPAPTLTPTVEPLGSTGNPLVIGFVIPNGDPQASTAARELAVRLTVQSSLAIQSRIFISYPELLKAMNNGQVHFAWLPPLTYLFANAQGYAEVSMLTNHFGVYYYGTQFFANVESGYTAYFDPASNANTANPDEALAQFAGDTPCWVEPDSVSGYILPAGILDEMGVAVNQGAFTSSATSTIRALYIQGICDFGATFSLTGDPRTSQVVLADLPDARERVMVIWRSDAIIPNLNLAGLPGLPDQAFEAVQNSFMDLVKSEEGQQLLTHANQYEIEDLRLVDDSVYDPLRGAVQRTRIDLNTTIGR